jgi:hypothetical protein
MTEPITLELTLKELQLLDKYVEKTDDTYSVLMKIKDAYPVFRSPAEEAYKDCFGEYPSGSPSEDARWGAFLAGYQSTQPKAKPMNEVMDRLENKYKQAEDNPKPKTLRSIINRWWCDTFTTHSKWDAEECMDDLADQIEFFYMRNKK